EVTEIPQCSGLPARVCYPFAGSTGGGQEPTRFRTIQVSQGRLAVLKTSIRRGFPRCRLKSGLRPGLQDPCCRRQPKSPPPAKIASTDRGPHRSCSRKPAIGSISGASRFATINGGKEREIYLLREGERAPRDGLIEQRARDLTRKIENLIDEHVGRYSG